MNRIIDIAVAIFILLSTCFSAVCVATGSLPAAMVVTYIAGVLLRIAYKKWYKSIGVKRDEMKKRKKLAQALVAKWSYLPDEAKAREYVLKTCDLNEVDFKLISCHASGTPFDINKLLEIWRDNQNRDKLLIAVTGEVDAKALNVSQQLESPKTRVIDARELSRIIVSSGLSIEKVELPKKKRLFGVRIEKKHAARTALYAVSSLLIYILTGKVVYLITASAFLFIIGLCLIRKPRTGGLFENDWSKLQ